jgi:ribose transport system substrate-binding protein
MKYKLLFMEVYMKKLVSMALVLFLAVGLAFGAGNKQESGKIKIGFSPYTLKNEYFTAVQKGVETACKELDFDVISLDPQSSETTQASQIENMVAQGIKALVYIPQNSKGARSVLQYCRDNGVKVVNIDNVVIKEDYDLVDAVIASDNIQLGYFSGQWVAQNHPNGANILIVHLLTAESCVVNVQGFWQGIKENAANPAAYKEVAVVEGGGATDKAFPVVQNALQAHPEIDVIFAINDTSALGAVQAVKDAGKTDKIDILGKDAAPIGKHAIKDGLMVQSSAQRPTYMGYQAVKTAAELLKGNKVQFETSIASFSVDKSNIDQQDLDAWDALP